MFDCYVMTMGEVVLLHGLSSSEFNGAVGIVEGVRDQRVIVRLLHNKQQMLVKSENLLEAGGNIGTSDEDVTEEDCCDNDSDGISDSGDVDMVSYLPQDNHPAEADIGAEDLNHSYVTLMDKNIDLALSLLAAAPPKSPENVKPLTEAFQLCQSTINLNSDNWVAYETFGELFLNCSDDANAVEAFNFQFQILSKKFPSSTSKTIIAILTKVLLKIASAKGRLLDSTGELETLLVASTISPANVHVFASIGDLFLDSGDVTKALEYFRHTVAKDPLWALGRFHLARALVSNNEPTAAFNELQVAVNHCSSKREDESVERGVKNFMMVARMIDSIAPFPDDANSITRALLRSVNMLQPEDESSLSESSESTKLRALVYFQLGQALEKQGAVVTNSADPRAPRTSGFYDGAISAFRKSCQQDPEDSSYKLALGNALRIRAHSKKSKEDLDDSIIVYQSGLLIDPGESLLLFLSTLFIITNMAYKRFQSLFCFHRKFCTASESGLLSDAKRINCSSNFIVHIISERHRSQRRRP